MKNTLLYRLLCLVLSLLLVLGCVACTGDTPQAGTESTAATTQPSGVTTQSTAPTQESTQPMETVEPTNPTEPTDPTEPVQPAQPLEYTLTQADVDEFYRLLSECEAISLEGLDFDAIDAASEALEESYTYLDAQCTTALILHYAHTSDADLEQQYLDCVDICTQADDAYMQMVKRVYQSGTPAKEYLFEGWTEQDIEDLMNYNEQVSLLQKRNAEISVAYNASNDDAEKISLYIELVGNNNALAQIYGYDNYYDFAYERGYERDYNAAAVSQLRDYAQTYLGEDVFYTALLNFYYSYYDLSTSNQVKMENLMYGDYDKLDKDYVQLYLQSLPGEMGQQIQEMIDHNSLFADANDAREGAFTTLIGDRSFCYFGPGYTSAMTVLHEGGHYYASLYMNLNYIPMDLAEVHSQGNEWLFTTFLEEHLNKKVQSALVDFKLYENVATILICLMVDEFEQIVYTTDLTGYTAADLDAIMDNVALQYFPDGDVADMLADMNAYWRLVVVDQPVYYISYAVSAIGAIGLFTMAQEDYDAAMAAYQKLCQEPLEDGDFLDNLRAAGLLTPFDEEFYQQLKALIEARS